MCGIFGIYGDINDVVSKKDINEALSTMRHRGPDAIGIWRSDNITLGHVRLSIIDLSSSSNQPYVKEEGVLSYNGEIYNFRNLQSKIGISENLESDTDFLITLLNKDTFLKYLSEIDGMWAFIYYNLERDTLVVSSDRYNKKPIYYYYDGDTHSWIFSSETKPFLLFHKKGIIEDLTFTRDKIKLNKFYYYGFVDDGETLIDEIKYFTPGKYVIYSSPQLYKEKTLSHLFPPPSDQNVDNNIDLNLLDKLIKEAVYNRMTSDVPITLLYSGGMDSTLILFYVYQKIFEKHADDNKISNIIYFSHKNDHDKYVKPIFEDLERAGIRLNVLYPEYKEIEDMFFKNKYLLSDLSDYLFFHQGILSRYITFGKITSKVVITGEGADELFYGYPYYRRYLRYKYIGKIIPLIRLLQKVRNNQDVSIYSSARVNRENLEYYFRYKIDDEILSKANIYFRSIPYKEKIKRLWYIDLYKDFIYSYIPMMDRVSMHFSVETRHPFLYWKIFEFSVKIPVKKHVSIFHLKKVLHRLYTQKYKEILKRKPPQYKKLGFGMLSIPKDLEDHIDEYIANAKSYIKNKIVTTNNTPILRKLRLYTLLTSYEKLVGYE